MADAAAVFVKEVLGSLPVAGPALSLLGFALEVVQRQKDDVEQFERAHSELAQVANITMGAICRAAKHKDECYVQDLARLLPVIESAARNLEDFDNRSTIGKYRDAVLKWKRGPVAVLEIVRQCKDDLGMIQTDHVDKVVMDIAMKGEKSHHIN